MLYFKKESIVLSKGKMQKMLTLFVVPGWTEGTIKNKRLNVKNTNQIHSCEWTLKPQNIIKEAGLGCQEYLCRIKGHFLCSIMMKTHRNDVTTMLLLVFPLLLLLWGAVTLPPLCHCFLHDSLRDDSQLTQKTATIAWTGSSVRAPCQRLH